MTPAVRAAIISGFILIIWSVISYFIPEPDERSPTAFIPVGFGGLMVLGGLIGRKERARKIAMHVVAFVALLGILGGFSMGLMKVFSDPGLAAYSQLFLGAVSLFVMVVCVRSFIAARKARG